VVASHNSTFLPPHAIWFWKNQWRAEAIPSPRCSESLKGPLSLPSDERMIIAQNLLYSWKDLFPPNLHVTQQCHSRGAMSGKVPHSNTLIISRRSHLSAVGPK
jgi:hypothetical protein